MRKFFILSAVFTLILAATFIFEHKQALADGSCSSDMTGKSKAQLQADLDACNADIAHWTQILNDTKQESASYKRDISALTAQINAAQSNIKAKNIAIANLSSNIAQKQTTITTLTGKINDGLSAIAGIMRRTAELDSYSLAETVLSNRDLSDFFADQETYAATQKSLNGLLDEIRGTRAQTEVEKAALAKQRQAAADAKAAIELAKKQVEVNQVQKQILLVDSQNKEKNYSQVLADRQAKAAQIRAILFNLRDAGPIPFGTALQYAQEAGAKTGIDPAFLLAILTQESNLGQNVGACYVTNLDTGDGVGKNTGAAFEKVMKSPRDTTPFVQITSAVGRDWKTTQVSCPIGGYKYYVGRGYGGAMGPAQFIPSTWQLFQDRIAAATGDGYPDPWSPRDAFFASAFYLSDLGASSGSYSAEKAAACKYYGSGGSSCAYGNQVMAKAQNIQTTMIDPLQNL